MATNATQNKKLQRERRHRRIRSRVHGTAERPRLAVFRSNRFIYAQLIDDEKGRTVGAASNLSIKAKRGSKKIDAAHAVGQTIAEVALAQRVQRVVFDRAGYDFSGRVKALAEAARKGGLEF